MSKGTTAVLVLSVALVTAAVAGGGVYVWQTGVQKTTNADYEDRISSLGRKVTQAQADAQTATEAATKKTADTATTPPVLYTGDGAASLTETEKADFVKKLTAPYIDYYAQDGQVPVVSILITVPSKKGDAYKVFAIRKSGGLYENFSYSKKGSALDTWKPTCGPTACSFSDAFKTKYPDVVK